MSSYDDSVVLRFEKFNDMAQFSADLFEATSDERIEPISPLQARVPRQHVHEFRHLLNQFNGHEDETGLIAHDEVNRSHMSHGQRAELNMQNARAILEESNELLRKLGQPK